MRPSRHTDVKDRCRCRGNGHLLNQKPMYNPIRLIKTDDLTTRINTPRSPGAWNIKECEFALVFEKAMRNARDKIESNNLTAGVDARGYRGCGSRYINSAEGPMTINNKPM